MSLAVVCLLMLPACAWLPPGWRSPPAALSGEPVLTPEQQVLIEHQRLLTLTPAAQTREMLRLNAALPEPGASVQLALLLAHKGSPGELARAVSLLERISQDDRAGNLRWQPLVQVLLVSWNEQRRLGERLERQTQQLKDSQRRQEQLSDTVAALKAIELSLPAKPAQAPGAGPAQAAPGQGAAP